MGEKTPDSDRTPKVDAELVEYVLRYWDRFPEQQIRGRLIQDGVPPKAIDLAFAGARASKAAPAPPPKPRRKIPWKYIIGFIVIALLWGGCVAVQYVVEMVRDPDFQGKLSSLLARHGAPGPAQPGAKEAAELRRKQEELIRKSSGFQTYATLALRSHKLGKHEEAARNATSALREWDPAVGLDNKKIMYSIRARSYELLGRHGQALADYRAITEADPKDPDGYLGRCRVHLAARDFHSALSEAGKLVSVAPDEPDGYAIQAGALGGLGRMEQAIAKYGEAISAGKRGGKLKEEPKRFAGLHFNRGAILANSGRYKEAVKDVSRAIALDPEEGYYYGVRAKIHDALGDRSSAREDRAKQRALGGGSSPGGGAPAPDLDLQLGPTLRGK